MSKPDTSDSAAIRLASFFAEVDGRSLSIDRAGDGTNAFTVALEVIPEGGGPKHVTARFVARAQDRNGIGAAIEEVFAAAVAHKRRG